MTRCATCGMQVDPSRALRLAEGGTTLFFCSPGCRAIYLQQRSRRTGTGRAPTRRPRPEPAKAGRTDRRRNHPQRPG